MDMRLLCHGGKCCGMRHIYGLQSSPSRTVCPVDKTPDFFGPSNGAGEYQKPGQNFFSDAAPQEPAWRRLDRYLEYCDRRRPRGIVEVVVVSGGFYTSQHDKWRRSLIKRGFKKVNECWNSNSSNTLHVYHRNSGEVPKIERVNSKVDNYVPF